MSSQAWMGLGIVAFGSGLFLLPIWRGFAISRVNLFGVLELNLPAPISVSPQTQALIPALMILTIGVTGVGIGFYYNLFPAVETVAITGSRIVQDKGQTTSQASSKAVNVTFLNRTDQPVTLYWIDFSGHPDNANAIYIAPGISVNVDTYVGHLWIAKSSRGSELLRYVARQL